MFPHPWGREHGCWFVCLDPRWGYIGRLMWWWDTQPARYCWRNKAFVFWGFGWLRGHWRLL